LVKIAIAIKIYRSYYQWYRRYITGEMFFPLLNQPCQSTEEHSKH